VIERFVAKLTRAEDEKHSKITVVVTRNLEVERA
jgi:serine protease inhibitor ecotin